MMMEIKTECSDPIEIKYESPVIASCIGKAQIKPISAEAISLFSNWVEHCAKIHAGDPKS